MIAGLKKVTKLCPQFHISVQSGCNNVLKAMNRHYTAEEYEELANKLRSTFDDATITTDVLVGFPTESEEDFKTTCEFVKRIGFEKVHVFPYSVREGTVAAKMEQHTNAIKDKRAADLIKVTEKIRADYLKAQISKTVEVLFETQRDGFYEGYTKNYTPVRTYTKDDLHGKVLNVTITEALDDYCVGRL